MIWFAIAPIPSLLAFWSHLLADFSDCPPNSASLPWPGWSSTKGVLISDILPKSSLAHFSQPHPFDTPLPWCSTIYILYPNSVSASVNPNICLSHRDIMPSPAPQSFAFCVPLLKYAPLSPPPPPSPPSHIRFFEAQVNLISVQQTNI